MCIYQLLFGKYSIVFVYCVFLQISDVEEILNATDHFMVMVNRGWKFP